MATARLHACAKPGSTPAMADLFEPGVTPQRMIEAFRSLRVPRRLFKFLYAVIAAHCNAHTDADPAWKISATLYESTLAISLRDQDAFDRGVGAAGYLLVHRTPPYHFFCPRLWITIIRAINRIVSTISMVDAALTSGVTENRNIE